MNPEDEFKAIDAQLETIRTTLEEHGESLVQLNNVRDDIKKLRDAIEQLAKALVLLPHSYQAIMMGKGGNIVQSAERVIADLKK